MGPFEMVILCAQLRRVADEFQALRFAAKHDGRATKGIVVDNVDVAGPAGTTGHEVELRSVTHGSEVLAGFAIRQAPSFTDIGHSGNLFPFL